jgi:cytochrome c peroxidase
MTVCVRACTMLAAALTAALSGCGGGGTEATDTGLSTATWTWRLPAGFPVPVVPADNPMSEAKVELGRRLFYEVRLSGNGTQSCASCHLQALAFTDGRATALGSTGESHPRNAQPLANVAYSPRLTWANFSLDSLERQMLAPLFGDNPVEMGVNDRNQAEVLARIRQDSDYRDRFEQVYAGQTEPVTWDTIIKSIAAFQRSIISGNSRYDRAQRGEITLNAAEIRGMNLFNGEKAECFHCHGSFNFNDQTQHLGLRLVDTPFHNTGLYNIDGRGGFPAPNRGIYELSGKPEDMGKFRAQSLRNVAVTAPYMHDGSIATLEEVLDFYAAGGRVIASGPHAGDGRLNPYRSELIGAINLTPQDKADLVAFLKTLTDTDLLTDPRFSDPFKASQ